MTELVLPSVFSLRQVEKGFPVLKAAEKEACLGTDAADGTLFLGDASDWLQLALILRPESDAILPDQVRRASEVALVDALGALLPPQLPVQSLAPDGGKIALDGSPFGHISVSQPLSETLILHIELPIGGQTDDVSLSQLGASTVKLKQLVESLTKHLIHWLVALEDKGAEVIARAWRARLLQAPLNSPGDGTGGQAS